jgi:wobble nucleotide-excising tRNase
VYFRLLQSYDVELSKIITVFLVGCQKRQEDLLKLLNNQIEGTINKIPDSGISGINKIIEKLNLEIEGLKTQNVEQKIADLENQLLTLKHRQILFQLLPDIERYINNLIWAQKASRIKCDTKHITLKYKTLFENIVTDRYIELFNSIIYDLKRPLQVGINTTGKKARSLKQIVVKTDPSAPANLSNPEKILSEGEKRAVAVADFLTEVTLDDTSKVVILDDPVTSLDLEWRETLASILVKASKKRQVIIFTHDLPFLFFLKRFAEDEKSEIITHWIQRKDNIPGYISQNDSPALDKEHVKPTIAQGFYDKAKILSGQEQEYTLKAGFAALRECYEAFILYELFEEVVVRFDICIMFGRLKRIKWDDSIAEEANKKYELLSEYMLGHLQSDEYVVKPEPQLLLHEIQAYNNLRSKLKALKAKSQ